VTTASLDIENFLVLKRRNLFGRKDIFCGSAFLSGDSECSVETLAPGIGDSVLTNSERVRHSTRDLFDVEDTLNKSGYVAAGLSIVANAEFPVRVVSHGVDVATFA